MFLVAFSKEDKLKLIKEGYKYICENTIGNRTSYVFEDNKLLKFNIDETKVLKTNKLYF